MNEADLKRIAEWANEISKTARKLSQYDFENTPLKNILPELNGRVKQECESMMYDANKIWRCVHDEIEKEATNEKKID